MRNIYDNSEFFAAYAEMGRSKDGLKAAGEWHQLQPLFPKLQGKKVLDLGCGYGYNGMPGMCNEMRRPMMLLVKVKKV